MSATRKFLLLSFFIIGSLYSFAQELEQEKVKDNVQIEEQEPLVRRDVVSVNAGESYTIPPGRGGKIVNIWFDPFYTGDKVDIDFCGENIRTSTDEKVLRINNLLYYFGYGEHIKYPLIPFRLSSGSQICVPADHQTKGISILLDSKYKQKKIKD